MNSWIDVQSRPDPATNEYSGVYEVVRQHKDGRVEILAVFYGNRDYNGVPGRRAAYNFAGRMMSKI